MDKKSLIKDYLNFTRKERIAILIITTLLIIVLLLPFFTRKTAGMEIQEDSAWLTKIRPLKKESADTLNDNTAFTDRPVNTENETSASNRNLFYFDPNTLSADQWQRLGVKEKTIVTIKNYLSKGGVFRKPEDLQKIYGLSRQQYNLLAPYIRIETSADDYRSKGLEKGKNDAAYAFRNSAHFNVIDINTADTTALISLPGIGSKLATRIISFREKLGGFYSVDQIGEIYGLRDSVFQKIKPYLQCHSNGVKKININSATKDELKAHSYIRWNIANAIVEYRNQHGPFTSLDDLKKINAIDSTMRSKIIHYLTL